MAHKHRQEHAFRGDDLTSCEKCGYAFWLHRGKRNRTGRVDKRDRSGRIQERSARRREFYGIDGEGIGRENHRYILLSLSNIDGSKKYSIKNYEGLSTVECLDFLWGLPDNIQLVSYSDTYDLTKILEDVDDETLWKLWRPETRPSTGKGPTKRPSPVYWNGWEFNMQGTRFSLKKRGEKRNLLIWDIWKFYQSKFTGACTDWKVGTKKEIEEMDRMKNRRNELDKVFRENPQAVEDYNLKETMFMAELATRLVEAHAQAGLKLKTFYGAGSTATAILKLLEIDQYIGKGPDAMQEAIAKAYFGGRFDNAYIGFIPGPVYSYDLSSAYPYQIFQLPCLKCGTWKKTTSRREVAEATAALVHYRLKPSGTTNRNKHWGPFPYREKDGSISYPIESGGGWLWRDEFLAGEKYFDGVVFLEAWVYNTDCGHQPFRDIPNYYIERCRIGKEGPGIVLKLGINSVYGKLAQSIGRGAFQSWIWSGIVTSGCRAQVIEGIGLHKNRANLLMIATDGILTRERLELPKPKDTGTFEVWECKKHKKTCFECEDRTYKPLGGWEEKIVERDVFLARPGIYFPRDPTEEDIKSVRARGVGRAVIIENHPAIVKAWEQWNGKFCSACQGIGNDCKECKGTGGWPVVGVSNVGRFCGAKTSISRRVVKDEIGRPRFEYHRANGNHLEGEPRYGQWITREVSMSFNPFPKRDGLSAGGYLRLRRFPQDVESVSYKKAQLSKEAKLLKAEQEILSEQPTSDYAYY